MKGEERWNNSFSITQIELAAVARQVCRKNREGKSNSFVSDDEYLRSIDGMVQSIKDAQKETGQQGVTLDRLEW
ncbi:hypothetical protein GMJAKD_01545 [Candidatus Electrothrix aarhusensis]